MQGHNTAFATLLKKMAQDHTIALEDEQRARDASRASHERTQAKLRGKIAELREARKKATQSQASLRASEAENRRFVGRLAMCADERDTAIARLIKARKQRDAASGERQRVEEDVAILTDQLAKCTASLGTAEIELAVITEKLSVKEVDSITVAQSLATATAERDAAKQAVEDANVAMAEQGVRMSESAMDMVAQSETVAELRDLVKASRQEINVSETTSVRCLLFCV